MAALGCAAIVSLVAPVAAQATESVPTESVEATPVEAAPAEAAPVGTRHAETAPAEASPAENVDVAAAAKFADDLPPAQVNVTYRHQVTFTGRANALLAEHLPAGLRMDPSGLLTGTPTEARHDTSIKLAAFDLNSMRLVEQWVPLSVAGAEKPAFSGSLPAAVPNEDYRYAVQASVPENASLTFTANGLPGGYSMSPDGVITGTKDAKPGRYPVAITATTHSQLPGWVPATETVTWTLAVKTVPDPVITGTGFVRHASADETFSYAVLADAPADTSLTFNASGLPDGYSISPKGLITGKRDVKPGTYPVKITATAHHSSPGWTPSSTSVTWRLEVAEPARPVIGDDLVLPPATLYKQWSHRVTATAPAGRPSLTFTASGLPAGYSMTSDGLISGTGTRSAVAGSHQVVISVTAHAAGRPPVEGKPVTVAFEVLKGDPFPDTRYLPARPDNAPTETEWKDDLGSYHKVVWNGGLDHYEGPRTWWAECPADSWLDLRAGTDGRSVGRGVYVGMEYPADTWVWEATYPSRRTTSLPGGGTAVKDLRIEVTNPILNTRRGVYVEVTCTKDPAFAWNGK